MSWLDVYRVRGGYVSPWLKIMRARANQTGLRLSKSEVVMLSCDDAIQTVAQQDIEEREAEQPDAAPGRETGG